MALCKCVYLYTYICTFYFCLGGFSASAWMTSRGYTSPLNPSQTAELMTELDSQQYLLDTPCDSTAGIYASPTNGWTNGEYNFFLFTQHFKKWTIFEFKIIIKNDNNKAWTQDSSVWKPMHYHWAKGLTHYVALVQVWQYWS